MTGNDINAIIDDFPIEVAPGSKTDRIDDFLKAYRTDVSTFLDALSAIAHPNNFSVFAQDSIDSEVKTAMAADGLPIEWTPNGYRLTIPLEVPSSNAYDLDDPKSPVRNSEYEEEQSVDYFALDTEVPDTKSVDRSKVFVIYGRDRRYREFFAFLRAIGLHPLEWNTIVQDMGESSPYTLDVVKHGLSIAQAFVAFVTPDEHATLLPSLTAGNDSMGDKERDQPRPNVLIELGMALALAQRRTLVIFVGTAALGSDVAGINGIIFDGEAASRHSVAERLRAVGCAVNTSGLDWLDAGSFKS
ncbi:MAG TPA: TIR domain-containing protein [Candidatus Baltobacteraceae bacterium]|nr:TIR domain-containing protein [Candidatus Baltobacteraceae bacterium]